jgi:hypothetical protein
MVSRELEGLSVKLKNTRFGLLLYELDLDLYCMSYGDQRNSFHLRARWATQKTSSNIFLKNKRKLCYVR